MGVFTEHLTYRDAKGNTARTTLYTSQTTEGAATTAFGNVVTAMDAITNATLQSAIGAYEISPQPVLYGTNAEYASVEDKAVFTFQTAAGDVHRFKVPAPIAAIFKTDGETVDSANTDVVAYTTAITDAMSNRSGTAIAFFLGGTRTRVKSRKRLNINIKAPDLAGPAG